MNGLGRLPGAPGTAAEFAQDAPAQLAITSPYNTAGLEVYIDNSKVSPAPADTRLRAFTTY